MSTWREAMWTCTCGRSNRARYEVVFEITAGKTKQRIGGEFLKARHPALAALDHTKLQCRCGLTMADSDATRNPINDESEAEVGE